MSRKSPRNASIPGPAVTAPVCAPSAVDVQRAALLAEGFLSASDGAAFIDATDARALASELVELLQAPGSSPELPPESLPRLLAETAACIVDGGAQQGRAVRLITIGGFGSLVVAAVCSPLLPDGALACGRIAMTQALSAVLACGVRPTIAFAATNAALPEADSGALLAGGSEACAALALPLAAGRRLARGRLACAVLAAARVPPARLGRRGAQPGDRLLLAKALGGGILLEAWRAGDLSAFERAALLATAALPLTPGPFLACFDRVHALVGVGDCGLSATLLELCAATQDPLHARIDVAALPLLPGVRDWLEHEGSAVAARRNLARDRGHIAGVDAVLDDSALLLADAQPGGGVLVCCAPEGVSEVLAVLLQFDFGHAAMIGEIVAGAGAIELV